MGRPRKMQRELYTATTRTLTSFKWVSIWIRVRAFSRKRMSNPEGTLYVLNLFSCMLASWANTNEEWVKPTSKEIGWVSPVFIGVACELEPIGCDRSFDHVFVYFLKYRPHNRRCDSRPFGTELTYQTRAKTSRWWSWPPQLLSWAYFSSKCRWNSDWYQGVKLNCIYKNTLASLFKL